MEHATLCLLLTLLFLALPSLPEYLHCVELLRRECAEVDQRKVLRSPTAVAHSFQLYLMYSPS